MSGHECLACEAQRRPLTFSPGEAVLAISILRKVIGDEHGFVAVNTADELTIDSRDAVLTPDEVGLIRRLKAES